jgi:O-antigen ligase
MKETEVITLPFAKRTPRKLTWKVVGTTLLILVFIGLFGTALAYMNATGDWLYAAVFMAIIPALVILHNYPFAGLLIWLLLMPFLLQTISSASRQVYWIVHRGLPLLTLLFMWIASATGVKKRKLPKLGVPEYSMIGYIILTIITILIMSNDAMQTIFRFYDLIIIPMCLYMIIRLYVPSEKSLRWLVPIALFITITQVVVGILSWVAPSILPSVWLGYAGARTTGTLTSVSVYTTTILFTGLILINVGLQTKNKWTRYLFVLMFFLMIYATFISYSRASWLAGILVLCGLVLLYPKFMSKLIITFVVLGMVLGSVFLSSGSFQTAAQRFYSPESEQSALSRLPVYVAAIRMFQEKPLFGWGYDNFDRFDRKYQGRFGELVIPDEKDHTSHNIYLTMLAEQGIIGITLYLIPFGNLLLRSRKTFQKLPKRGLMGDKMFISFWLVILSFFVVQNFAPMVVVFGLGLNWITLGLIANYVHLYGSKN